MPAIFTIAQACLESNFGSSDLAINANNHFGIKADSSWTGPAYKGYRSYGSVKDSYIDHGKILKFNPIYAMAFTTTDPITFAQRVAAAGYAEDPQYFSKLQSIINSIKGLI